MIAVNWKELGKINPFVGKLMADFMESHDTAALPKGRIELTDGCYVNVDEYDTRENRRFEAHRLYADVQVLLSGREQILCAPLCDGTETVPYNPEKDIVFYSCENRPVHTVELVPGTAVLLMPWDLHAPCNAAAPSHNRKLIFKIPVALAGARTGKRIACCGDSITYGLGSTSPVAKSYPAVLQTLCGDGVAVGNFGWSGACANSAWKPYTEYKSYYRGVEYAAAMVYEPDLVVLGLGMNDGNPTHTFHVQNNGVTTPEAVEFYRRGLENLIVKLSALPSKPRLFLTQTTAMRRTAGEKWSESYVKNFTENLVPIRRVQQELAEKYGLPLIDTLTGMDDPAYYCDGCHLTDAGYARLAEIVYAAIKEYIG